MSARIVFAGLVMSTSWLAGVAGATPPAGVWSLPDSLAITGEDNSPFTSVIITGVFTVYSGEGNVGGDWGYPGFEPIAEGYMAYVCAPADKEACLAHWHAIEEAADQGRCVGWGAVGEDNGSVREHGTPSTSFDTWVLGEGVVGADSAPCSYLGSTEPGVPVAEDAGVADPDPESAPEKVDGGDTGVPPSDGTSGGEVEVSDDAATSDGGPDGALIDGVAGGDAQAIENTGSKDDGGCAGGGGLPALAWMMSLVPLLVGRQRRGR